MVGNIRTILEELGYSDITEYPKEFRTAPIYRDSSNKTSLRIRKDSGRWIDFAANATGDLADLVQISLKLKDVEEAKSWLGNRNIKIAIRTRLQSSQPKISTPEIFDKAALMRLSDDTSYWENRGVSLKLLQKFGGGIAYKGKMAGRYVFPVYNSRNDIVGFAGRDIFNSPHRPKWKLIGSKDKWVYPAFLNYQIITKQKEVILVESIGDCLSLFDSGIENVLVLFGLSIGSGILNFLLRNDMRHIIISTNNDEEAGKKAGNSAANKLANQLSSYFDPHQIEIHLPTKKDFGEMDKEEILLWQRKGLSQQAV